MKLWIEPNRPHLARDAGHRLYEKVEGRWKRVVERNGEATLDELLASVRAQPDLVRVPLPEYPPLHARRLLEALGAEWYVDADAAAKLANKRS